MPVRPKGRLLDGAQQHVVYRDEDVQTASEVSHQQQQKLLSSSSSLFINWQRLAKLQRTALCGGLTWRDRIRKVLYWVLFNTIYAAVVATVLLSRRSRRICSALWRLPPRVFFRTLFCLKNKKSSDNTSSGSSKEGKGEQNLSGIITPNTRRRRVHPIPNQILSTSITDTTGAAEQRGLDRIDLIFSNEEGSTKPPFPSHCENLLFFSAAQSRAGSSSSGTTPKYPAPVLGGDLATILPSQRPYLPNPYYRETVASAHDGGTLCVDWMFAAATTGNEDVDRAESGSNESNEDDNSGSKVKGIICIIPGLGSSSHSPYVETFVAACNQSGWHCAVLNTRGMGSTPLDRCHLAHAGFTEDIRTNLQYVMRKERLEKDLGIPSDLPLAVVGFSLGGGMLSRFLAEESNPEKMKSGTSLLPRIFTAVACCSPWDYHETSEHLAKPKQMMFYQKHLRGGLRDFFRKHQDILSENKRCDIKELVKTCDKLDSVHNIDEQVVVHFTPYRSRTEYYSATSAMPNIEKIQVPMMCLTALDDVITGPPPIDYRWENLIAKNPKICYVKMPTGGHIGFPLTVTQSLKDWRPLFCSPLPEDQSPVQLNTMEQTVLKFLDQQLDLEKKRTRTIIEQR